MIWFHTSSSTTCRGRISQLTCSAGAVMAWHKCDVNALDTAGSLLQRCPAAEAKFYQADRGGVNNPPHLSSECVQLSPAERNRRCSRLGQQS